VSNKRKQVTCKNCKKKGHFAPVCRTTQTRKKHEVVMPEYLLLLVEDKDVSKRNIAHAKTSVYHPGPMGMWKDSIRFAECKRPFCKSNRSWTFRIVLLHMQWQNGKWEPNLLCSHLTPVTPGSQTTS